MVRITVILLAALTSFAAGTACASEGLRVLAYCDGPGVRCPDKDDAEPGPELVKLTWCCPYNGGPCELVVNQSSCDELAEYAVVCDWGRTMPDGTIECYE